MSIGGASNWNFGDQPPPEDHMRMLQRFLQQPGPPATREMPGNAPKRFAAATAGPENDPEQAAPASGAGMAQMQQEQMRPPGNFFAEADNRPALPKITYGGASPEAMGMLDAQEQMDVRRRAGLNGGIDPISFKKRLDELGGYGGVGMLHGHEDDPREQAIARASSAANDRRARMAESMLGNEMQLAMERGYGQFSGGPPSFGMAGGRLGVAQGKLKVEQGELDLKNKINEEGKAGKNLAAIITELGLAHPEWPEDRLVTEAKKIISARTAGETTTKPPAGPPPPAASGESAQDSLKRLYSQKWNDIIGGVRAAGVIDSTGKGVGNAVDLVKALRQSSPDVVQDNMPLVMKWADELFGGSGAAERAVTANPFFATVLRAPTSSLPVGSQIGRGWDEIVRRLGGKVPPNPQYEAEDAVTNFIRGQAAKQK